MFSFLTRYFTVAEKKKKILMITLIRECLTDLNYTGSNAVDRYTTALQEQLGTTTFEDSERHGILCHFLTKTPWIAKTRAVVNFLFDHEDTNVNSPSGKLSRTPLMLLCEKEEENNILMRKLIYRGANLHDKDNLGSSPLHCAVANHNSLAIETLLDYDANIDCVNNCNWTPLYWACRYDSQEMIKILLKHNAKRYMPESIILGKTPIEGALFDGNIDSALLIFQNGKDFPPELLCSVTYHLITGSFSLDPKVQEKRLQLFHSIWNKDNIVFTKLEDRSILFSYLQNHIYQPNEWFNCLKIMLTSKIARELTEDFDLKKFYYSSLIFVLNDVPISKSQRMELIQLFVSCGYSVSDSDVFWAFVYYGLNEETEFLIYNLERETLNIYHPNTILFHLLCGLEEDFNYESIFSFLGNYQMGQYELILFILTHFSLTKHSKQVLLEKTYSSEKSAELVQLVNSNPNLPSLVELSRNATRKLIQAGCEFYSPREFYENIDKLKVPVKIKNLMKLKTPPSENYVNCANK